MKGLDWKWITATALGWMIGMMFVNTFGACDWFPPMITP